MAAFASQIVMWSGLPRKSNRAITSQFTKAGQLSRMLIRGVHRQAGMRSYYGGVFFLPLIQAAGEKTHCRHNSTKTKEKS